MTTTHERLQAQAEPDRRQRPVRDPWLDNTKLLLITLVVVGHSWALLPHTTVTNWLYDSLYLWHMPAFLIVTGYLSRSFTWSRRRLRRLVTGVLVPYLLFEGALVLFRWSFTHADYDNVWLEPHWPMWFLLALFFWRLATPALRAVPYVLALSVVGSLVVGLYQLDYLQLDRVFGFLPFFMLGLLATPEQLERLRRPRARQVALPIIAAGAVVGALVAWQLPSEWLYYRSGYDALGVSPVVGVAVRSGLLVTSTALALAFLAWMPRRRTRLTALGTATLVVYLFHGFVLKAAEYLGLPGWAADHPLLSLVLVTVGGVAVALLLAAPPVARRLSLVVEPTTAVETIRRS